MSIKSKALAGTAALAIASSLGAGTLATAGAAHAATPSCGSTCIDVFSKNFGTYRHPGFVMDVYKQGQKVGQPIILFRTSNSDPAEDFTVASEGSVSDFKTAGLMSSAIALHYGGTCKHLSGGVCTSYYPDDYAFEVEYAPYGAETGLCVGLASAAVSNEKVTLQPCGASAKTTWVADTIDSCPTNPLYSLELPLINGSDTNFSHPFVLAYPGSSFPTDSPRPQLFVNNLTGFSQTGGGPCGGGSTSGPDNNQLWAARTGVLP